MNGTDRVARPVPDRGRYVPSCLSQSTRVLLIGVTSEHLAPGRQVGAMAEPRAGAEEQEGERHEGGPARRDVLARLDQGDGDPGDEQPEDERGPRRESRD